MEMRTISLKLHRWCGLAIGLFLLNAGLSGATLVFRDDLDDYFNADAVQVERGAATLPVAVMMAALAEQRPDAKLKRFFTGADAGKAWRFQLAPRGGEAPLASDEVWIDPYTGRVTGERLMGAARLDRRHLMPMIQHWHDSLYMGKTGLSIIGTVALVWLLSSLLGIYLAIPRAGSLLKALVIKRGASTFKLVYDSHRVVGLVTCVVLLGSTFSATYLGLPNQFKAVVGLFSPVTEPLVKTLAERKIAPQVSMDQAIDIARAALPGATLRGLSPHADKGVYQVRLRLADDINAGNGTGRVIVDMRDGAVREVRSFKNAGSAGDTVLAWMYPLHSGQAFGTPGRIVIVLIGVVPGVLALTGAWIWWRRRSTLAARRTPARAAA